MLNINSSPTPPALGLEEIKLKERESSRAGELGRKSLAGEKNKLGKLKNNKIKRQLERTELQNAIPSGSLFSPGKLGAGGGGWEGKSQNGQMNGWFVSLQRGLQLDTNSPNTSPVSQAGSSGRQALQALHRVADFKGELKLF